MYAIIENGGKQYKAVEGGYIEIDLAAEEVGKKKTFEKVLLLSDDTKVDVGTPYIKGATVDTTIVSHFKGPKIIVFKYRAKQRYRVKTGHRQKYTRILVDSIAFPGKTSEKKVTAVPESKPAPAKKKKTAAEPKATATKSKSATAKPKASATKSKSATAKPKASATKSKSVTAKPKVSATKSKSAAAKPKTAAKKAKTTAAKPKAAATKKKTTAKKPEGKSKK